MEIMDKDNSTEKVIMLPSTESDPQYVISLDSLDSHFLRKYTEKTSDEVKTLWSKSEMNGESTLWQVELHSKLEDEDYCIASELVTTCHICNLEVPRTCYKKHLKSKTHKIYLKLAKTMLENVTRYVKVNLEDICIDFEESAYYCETCSKLVQVGCILKHNQSSTHLKAIEEENLTKRFHEMYTIKDASDWLVKRFHDMKAAQSDYESEDEDIIGTELLSPTILSENEFEEVDSDTEFEKVNIDACVVDFKDCITSEPTTEELRKARKELMLCFKLYLKLDVSKQNLKMPIITTNSVIVETPKGYKEKVSFDAFHSYKRMSKFVFCQVCQTWTGGKGLKRHSTSTKHITGIMLPLNDNFERQMINRCNWYLPPFERRHCLLCNEAVLSQFNHTFNNPNHMKYKQEHVIKQIKLDKTICKVCNISIDAHNYINHTKGKKHMKNEKKKSPMLHRPGQELNEFERTNKTLDELIIEKLVLISEQDAKKEDKTYCSSCDVHIDTHNFIAHVNAPKHKKILKTIMSKKADSTANKSNNMRKRDKSTFCNTCQVHVPKDGMDMHVQGKSHRRKTGMALNKLTEVVVVDNQNIPSTSKPVRGKQSRTQQRKMRAVMRAALHESDNE